MLQALLPEEAGRQEEWLQGLLQGVHSSYLCEDRICSRQDVQVRRSAIERLLRQVGREVAMPSEMISDNEYEELREEAISLLSEEEIDRLPDAEDRKMLKELIKEMRL